MKQHTFTRFIVVLTFYLCSCLSSFGSIFGSMASGASPLPPKIYEAIVVKVIDGDTLEVKIKLWNDLEKTARLRIRGIDAPELRGKCRQEKILAKRARDHLRAFLGIRKARKKRKSNRRKFFCIMSSRANITARSPMCSPLRVKMSPTNWCARNSPVAI